MYFVYLLECKDGSIYTGITNDIKRRFEQHRAGTGGHYTKSRGAEEIVYSEQVADRSTALRREVEIKSWTRQKKLNLIRFGRP